MPCMIFFFKNVFMREWRQECANKNGNEKQEREKKKRKMTFSIGLKFAKNQKPVAAFFYVMAMWQ